MRPRASCIESMYQRHRMLRCPDARKTNHVLPICDCAQDGVEAAQTGASAAATNGKKAAKSQPADGMDVTLDTEWVSAHASQVAKMLPGGEIKTAF